METVVDLPNGKCFKIVDTGKPYVDGEYTSGGIAIYRKNPDGLFIWLDNSPDMECVQAFLRMASRCSQT